MPRLTFKDLAPRVLEQSSKSLTAEEIWALAEQRGYVAHLSSKGSTPWKTLSSDLYTESQKPHGRFERVGKKPVRFRIQQGRQSPILSQDDKAKRQKATFEYGPPISFRGLRHEPINEQGVVFLFGMVAHELGFSIEAVQSAYPGCVGKRQKHGKKGRWEQVKIEFEYRSSHFKTHGHDANDCDMVICWIHDWSDCPVEVIELKNEIENLPNELI
jgi:hypothetical protein